MYTDASTKDKFSYTNEETKINYPVGLMTVDEVAFAGGKYSVEAPYTYFFSNSTGVSVTNGYWWWTMSPAYFISGAGGGSYVFYVCGSDKLGRLDAYEKQVNNSYGIRPVISLKLSVLVKSGNGTSSDFYTIEGTDD